MWTGTQSTGSQSGARCGEWISIIAGQTGLVGQTDRVDAGWTSTVIVACTLKRALYCFEQ